MICLHVNEVMFTSTTPYTIITVLMSAVYFFSIIKCSTMFEKITTKGAITYWPWSNKEKYKTIKRLSNGTKDIELQSLAKKYIFYLNLGHYTVYIGVILMVVFGLIGA